jgi:hypothetical protein
LPLGAESTFENPDTSADDEFPALKRTPAATIEQQTDIGASQEALARSRYLDPQARNITTALSPELALFYAALLTPVSPLPDFF